MRLLLDTHALLWWRDASPRLSRRAHAAIADADNEIFVSVASLWEIVIKRALGRLRFPDDLELVMREEEFELMPVALKHLHALDTLPMLHRDPFDRMLVAQSLSEAIPVVTADRAFPPYAAAIFW
jgi:PIN domain nuclease of toxin-antitoxin system